MNGNRNKLLLLYANSFFAYIGAFLTIFIPAQLLVNIVARGFGIPTRFDYFKLVFPIADHSYLWTQFSVSLIYAASPFLAMVAAVVVFRLYLAYSGRKGLVFNLFFIWFYTHCINILFGSLLIGIPLVKDFGYVPNWLYASSEAIVYLILISALCLLLNGVMLRKAFNSLCFDEKYFNSPYHSLVFKMYIAILPALSVAGLFSLLSFPDNALFSKLLHFAILIQLSTILPFTTVHISIAERFRDVAFSYRLVIITVSLFLLFTAWKIVHNLYYY